MIIGAAAERGSIKMNIFMKLLNHCKTIIIHKFWVGYFCFQCGLYWQGLVHDLSKFSPIEFFESIKYYCGDRSPIDKCKEVKGYSLGWLHHRGRNKHHYEYWTDNYDKGTTCIKMPWKYALEMLCDYLGAGMAYKRGDFTIENEIEWWEHKKQFAKMHPDTKLLFDICFKYMINTKNIKNMSDIKSIKKILNNSILLEFLRKGYELGNLNIMYFKLAKEV